MSEIPTNDRVTVELEQPPISIVGVGRAFVRRMISMLLFAGLLSSAAAVGRTRDFFHACEFVFSAGVPIVGLMSLMWGVPCVLVGLLARRRASGRVIIIAGDGLAIKVNGTHYEIPWSAIAWTRGKNFDDPARIFEPSKRAIIFYSKRNDSCRRGTGLMSLDEEDSVCKIWRQGSQMDGVTRCLRPETPIRLILAVCYTIVIVSWIIAS